MGKQVLVYFFMNGVMEVKLKIDDYGNYSLAITELRRHPTFVITTLAVRILTSGIIPIILLIFFYAKVICFDLLCYPVEGATNNYFFFATHCVVWHSRLWSFQWRDTKLERFLAKKNCIQMKKKSERFRWFLTYKIGFESQILALFDTSPFHQFAKCNDFI